MNVTLHGILAKEFKKTFCLEIKRPKEVFDAISCSYSNFRNRIVELAHQGIHFVLLVDGKKITTMEELSIASDNQQIDIVPLVCGAGRAGMIIAVIALGVLTAGAGFVIGAAAGTAGALFGSATAFIGQSLVSIGVGIAMMGIQMALAPKPNMDRPSADVNSAKQSFLFSSKANTAEQGIPVPVGYGRLRVGSAVVQSTIKSYPQAFEKENALFVDGQSRNNDRNP